MLTDFLCLAALAAANGANDVSRAAATLVGGRVTTYKRALTWVVAWTFGGSLLSGVIALGVARRFAAALGTHQDQLVIAVPAILLGSTVWIGISTYRRLPVATTHALVGSLLGVMWFVGGWAACKRIDLAKGFVIPLLASPVLAVMCSGLLRKLMPGFIDSRPSTLNRAHWVSAGMTAFRRGVNDSAKIWAMLLPLVAIVGLEVTAFTRLVEVTVAVAMMIGSLVAGARVTKNLAFRVTPMSCTDSVTANVVTASIIIAASLMSFPVASSHVVSGAILGVGLASNRHALRWATIAEIATAWLLTLPAAAVLSVTLYLGIIEARRADGFEIWLCVMAAATAVLLMLLIYRRGHSGGSAMSGAASLPMTSSLGLRLIVFVCNSNTSRSPMAAQICKAVLAKMRGTLPDGSVDVLSRGISAIDGETMGPLAANALAKLGIVPKIHRASNLSLDIAEKADLILCMTDAQVRQVIEVFPSCLAKVFRLHLDIDVPNPAGLDQEAFESVARLISKGIGNRMEQIITV